MAIAELLLALLAIFAAAKLFGELAERIGQPAVLGEMIAQLGLSAGLLSTGLYSSVALMVMITTFVAPPALRSLLARAQKQDAESALCDVVTEAFTDD